MDNRTLEEELSHLLGLHHVSEDDCASYIASLPTSRVTALHAHLSLQVSIALRRLRSAEPPARFDEWLHNLCSIAGADPDDAEVFRAIALERFAGAYAIRGAAQTVLTAREWLWAELAFLDALIEAHSRFTRRPWTAVLEECDIAASRQMLLTQLGNRLADLFVQRVRELDLDQMEAAASTMARVDAPWRWFVDARLDELRAIAAEADMRTDALAIEANRRRFASKKITTLRPPPPEAGNTSDPEHKAAHKVTALSFPPRSVDEILRDLDALPGLVHVKSEIHSLVAQLEIQQLRVRRGLPERDMVPSLVFRGHPGTGKTMIARIMAELLAATGVMPQAKLVETDPSGFIAMYGGQTRERTRETFVEALGGVLFVDEAYGLARADSFGLEAIDTLVKLMEDHRHDVSLILAGYPNEMDQLTEKNPGLASRIALTVDFADYHDDELVTVFELLAHDLGYLAAPGCDAVLLKRLEPERLSLAFGNARSVRRLLDEAIRHHAERLHTLDRLPTDEELYTLIPDDLQARRYQPGRTAHHTALETEQTDAFGRRVAHQVRAASFERRSVDEILAELDQLPGLHNAKREVRDLAALVAVSELREEAGLTVPRIMPNFVFLGSPGTGKTTIARLMAELLASLGITKKPSLVETDRTGLIDIYHGQSSHRTRETLMRALGGVLFIDEAYSLMRDEQYGLEAIDTLVKLLEEHRGDVVVIIAGYPRQMSQLLTANPGLASRFSTVVEFEDFTDDELEAVFDRMAGERGYKPDADCARELAALLVPARKLPNFGNARTVRTIVDEAIKQQARRLAELPTTPTAGELELLTGADVRAVGPDSLRAPTTATAGYL